MAYWQWLTYALPLILQLARCRVALLAQHSLALKCLRLGNRLTALGRPMGTATTRRDVQG